MENLFIHLSDDVLISILQNWPLWLVLWSRVTYFDHIYGGFESFLKLQSFSPYSLQLMEKTLQNL